MTLFMDGELNKDVQLNDILHRECHSRLFLNLYGPADNFDLDTSHVFPAVKRDLLGTARTIETNAGISFIPAMQGKLV